ncbi:MAG: hypothetical protein KJN93_07635 [Alphaproteobacteria bacterium]|nr:hypothetical protein [Alphaproteobacteria bacterium]
MVRAVFIAAFVALAACGTDTPSSQTAGEAADRAAARDAAQAGRIDNPEALACVRANASDEEWAVISRQDAAAETALQTVLNRESTVRCFIENNVVVYT